MAGFLVKLAIKKGESKLAEKGASKGGDSGRGTDISGIGGDGLGSSIARDYVHDRLNKRAVKRASKYSD